LNLHRRYTLTINGTTSSGLKNPSGDLLDGAGNGQPGSDYVTTITGKILAGRANQRPQAPTVSARVNSLITRAKTSFQRHKK
jgi:hypothetical protein